MPRWLRPLPRAGSVYLAGPPLLIAHRGGSALAPENTLTAFRQAVDWWGADLLEIDVQPTLDGEAVVFHDSTVDRTTDAKGPVAGFTLAEIRRLDAGYRYTPDAGRSFPYRDAGVAVSTLGEVLDAFPWTRINIEIKDSRAQERVWEVVHAAGATHRVLIAAGKLANRSRFGSYRGAVSASGEEMRSFYLRYRLGLARFWTPPVDAFQMPERHAGHQVLSPRLVAALHVHNVAVHVWTVDEIADMRRLLGWGVDGIVTDRPDRLARVLHEMFGRPLPRGPEVESLPPSVERLLRA